MPVIIDLTTKNGVTIYVNASKILQFSRMVDQKSTRIWYDLSWDDSTIHVQETPEQIINKIREESVIGTQTTIFTEDYAPPHIYTD